MRTPQSETEPNLNEVTLLPENERFKKLLAKNGIADHSEPEAILDSLPVPGQ